MKNFLIFLVFSSTLLYHVGGAPEHFLVETEDGHQEPGMDDLAEKVEDFHWSAWGEWGKCSAKCGPEGTRKRHRKCMDSDGEEVKGKCKPFFNKTLKKQFADTDFKECKPCPNKGMPCKYKGKTYKHGKSMPCYDGCNTGICWNGQPDGCTEMLCGGWSKLRQTTNGTPCKYRGKTYQDGESMPCDGWCNERICKNGHPGECTKLPNIKCTYGKPCTDKETGKIYKHKKHWVGQTGCDLFQCWNGMVMHMEDEKKSLQEHPCNPKLGFSCNSWWMDGKTYKDGESMPCDDIKCNYAKCKNGLPGPCTEVECPTRSSMDR